MTRSTLALFAMCLAICFCLGVGVAHAQDAPKSQLLAIHEDNVYPSKVEEYENAAKSLADAIKANKAPISYTAAFVDDYTYLYFTPVDDYGAIDKMNGDWSQLQEKMGKGPFDGLMKSFDGCYPTHRNYMVRLRPDLSYNPTFGAQVSDGLNFRHWDYYYIHTGMEDEAEAIAKEWVALNEKIKWPEGYRLYVNAYGAEGPLFIVTSSAKSASDFYTRNEEWMKKTGEAGQELMKRTMKVVRKFESKDGMIRPDLSSSPKPVIQSK